MNYIDEKRNEIKNFFNPGLIIQDSKESVFSPSKHFRIDKVNYKQDKADVNWEVTKVSIYDLRINQILFDFFINDSSFFYSWIDKGNIEFLICAEDIFGGQTVIDLTNRKMSSYSPGEDGFIWTDFHLSPDGNTLATIGCYWACPNEIKLYDFSDPMNLPLKEIKELEISNSETIKGWIDNKTLLICGWQAETVREQTEDGTFKYKMAINKTEPEREIILNLD
jgi:hypothetical protein